MTGSQLRSSFFYERRAAAEWGEKQWCPFSRVRTSSSSLLGLGVASGCRRHSLSAFVRRTCRRSIRLRGCWRSMRA